LIGAGLASKAVGFFEYYSFSRAVGGDVAETGDGPGSFKVEGNMWHFTWGNPEVCPHLQYMHNIFANFIAWKRFYQWR
jgi:hypothetical protein